MVIIARDKISEAAWKGSPGLAQKLEGSPDAIREAYLFVGDLDNSSTWKGTHHEIHNDSLVISRAGVDVAAQQLLSVDGTNLPKKAAARHLLRHYSQLHQEAPRELAALKSYVCYEEAASEVNMLITMNIGVASGYNPDSFIKPKEELKSIAEDLKASGGICEELPAILAELDTLPIMGIAVKAVSLDEILTALEDLEEKSLRADYETADAEENTPEAILPDYDEAEDVQPVNKEFQQLQKRIKEKSSNVDLHDDMSTLTVRKAMNFSNKGKRTADDYRPSPDELKIINSNSNTDMNREDGFSFDLESADLKDDRQHEKFDTVALDKGAQLSLWKAFLIDHDWVTDKQLGIIYAARNEDGILKQKVFVLDIPENQKYIKNMLAGIYNKVSVGFSSNLNDMHCLSCGDGRSIYDSSCPHMPGSYDEKGARTTVLIKDMSDFYEVSLVPVPAQRDAGIRRRSLTITPEMIDKAASTENVDTINSVKDHGDDTVSKPTKVDSIKEADVFAAEAAITAAAPMADDDDDDKALTTGEVAGRVNTELEGVGQADIPDNDHEPAAPAPKAPKYSKKLKKICKSFKATVKELKEIAQALKSSGANVANLAEGQKSLEAQVTALKGFVEAATATTFETLERQAAAKKVTSTVNGAEGNAWAMELTKGILGGKH